ncbi:MAG: hypothetical protein HUK13_09850 [Muribaculaceae bacterium]|nr:hypothetical protein [Muribaculaceae bacterium]MCF0214715.1 hypothetical protein [Muribaculaceae bacterium]
MKKIFFALIATTTTACAFAQTVEKMVVRQADGTETKFRVTSIDKVYFEEDEVKMDYVDLGLKSGTKWATCNLGANAPEEYGDYYGWGCIDPYAEGDNITWPLYFLKIGGTGTSGGDCGTAKDPLQEYVNPNYTSISSTDWDAAKTELGGNWCMPTEEDLKELTTSCIWSWTTVNGVDGYTVTNKSDATKYIFLPAAGYRYGTALEQGGTYGHYWCADPHTNSPNAIRMTLFSAYRSVTNAYRYYGLPIRPVYKEQAEN